MLFQEEVISNHKKGMMQMISLPLVQIITRKMIGIVLELFNFAYQGIRSVGITILELITQRSNL